MLNLLSGMVVHKHFMVLLYSPVECLLCGNYKVPIYIVSFPLLLAVVGAELKMWFKTLTGVIDKWVF